jgi:pimeloyl-ACP methyl ester carboxylesterase
MLVGRRLQRAAVRVGALALVVVAVSVSVGIGWQALAERDLRARFPPPGELVELGDGRRIHLRQWGAGNPGPKIVLDAAASNPSSSWALLARELARTHHVVAYDRPGMAWSSGHTGPRDATTAATALREALEAAHVRPPYVLVAHSYGGFSSRVFAHLYREDVLALVLIDTTHEDGGGERGFATWYRLAAWRNHLGLNQLWPPANGYLGLPPADADAAHAVSLWASHADATADELEAWSISAAQLRAAGDLGDLPLLVIGAYGSAEHDALQRDLTRLSARSTYTPLEIWHTSLLFNADHARIVAEEISRFLVSASPTAE